MCFPPSKVESLCPKNLSLSLWLQGGALDRRPVPAALGMPQALAAELLRECLGKWWETMGIAVEIMDFF